MDAAALKQRALDYLDTFSTRDPDQILPLMIADPEWRFFGQRFHGSDGVRAIIKASAELYQEGSTEREIEGVFADGDTVVVQSTLRATTFKGEPYENYYVMFIRFEGALVRRVDEYLDTAYANEKFSGWEMS